MASKHPILGPASIWRRLAAFFIDMMVLELALFPLQKISTQVTQITDISSLKKIVLSTAMSGKFAALLFIIGLLTIAYFALLEHKLQQTPGKMLMKIYVASETKQLNFWQCIVRSLFLLPGFPFIILTILDPIFLLFSKTSQRFSEKLSKTRTVQWYLL